MLIQAINLLVMDRQFTIHLTFLFVQAALGDTVEVPTVHGNVEMVIPAGTQTGKTFRLKGKGAPRLRGGSQGDQLVTVKIVTPTKLNDAQKKLSLHSQKQVVMKRLHHRKKGFFNKVKDALRIYKERTLKASFSLFWKLYGVSW